MGQPVEQTKEREIEWETITWSEHKDHVRRIQERIFRATQNKNFGRAENLQKLLVRSHSTRLIATRLVTQENHGKYTAGIDGLIYCTSAERSKLVEEIRAVSFSSYRSQPVKRVYIPKSDGRQRPLGIPTIKDRVLQMMVKMALEPEWEARFEPNSYGFRPGRRCMDAIVQIKQCTKYIKNCKTNGWILDADIKGCFDNIDHSMLLSKIPLFTKVIRQWLKSGAIEFGQFYNTKSGTPQGGIISPLLANISLDGLERLFGCETSNGVYLSPANRYGINAGISVIRYADDFVVISPSKERIEEYILPKIAIFLKERGLTLNLDKTRILHITEGLKFLGFTVQLFNGKPRPFCATKPSKEAAQRHLAEIKEYLDGNKQAPANEVIKKLNPIIRGWGEYYKYSNAKLTFNYVDYRIWTMLWQWCLRRHPNKSKTWVRQKYFMTINGRKWIFAVRESLRLEFTASIRVRSNYYAKVKGYNSPFDPSLHEYWYKRARGKKENMDWDLFSE